MTDDLYFPSFFTDSNPFASPIRATHYPTKDTPVSNELAPTTSVFDNIQLFDQTMHMAATVAKSAFVPKAFQGSPESCLVVLDIARRLNVSPMTVFQHVYVIDAKPAFSTQFLISIVNNSRLFDRIEWETGTDGTIKATFCDYKNGNRETWTEEVPNLYAVAKLTERKTGKQFTSQRVDIAFAEKNGWTSKPGSKWRTMPDVMCAYRSASILIKRVCPELILGLNFAEDVEDSAEVIDVKSDVYLEPTDTLRVSQSRVDEYLRKIVACENLDELDAVAALIKEASFSAEERKELGLVWKNQKAELVATDAPTETVNETTEQPAPVETTKEKKTATPKQRATFGRLVDQLHKCRSREEATQLAALADAHLKKGELTELQFLNFGKSLDSYVEERALS